MLWGTKYYVPTVQKLVGHVPLVPPINSVPGPNTGKGQARVSANVPLMRGETSSFLWVVQLPEVVGCPGVQALTSRGWFVDDLFSPKNTSIVSCSWQKNYELTVHSQRYASGFYLSLFRPFTSLTVFLTNDVSEVSEFLRAKNSTLFQSPLSLDMLIFEVTNIQAGMWERRDGRWCGSQELRFVDVNDHTAFYKENIRYPV